MPYLENNQGALRTPAKAPGKVYLTFDGGTGGYGYNYRYLAPLRMLPSGTEVWEKTRLEDIKSTSQTVCFVTAARAVPNSPLTGGAGLFEVGVAEPPSRSDPSVHHRFTAESRTSSSSTATSRLAPIEPGTSRFRPTRPKWSSFATRRISSTSARTTSSGIAIEPTTHSFGLNRHAPSQEGQNFCPSPTRPSRLSASSPDPIEAHSFARPPRRAQHVRIRCNAG